MQKRTRTIKSQASCNGVPCQSKMLEESQTCQQYVDADCVTTLWSAWTTCTNGCGNGTSVRTRKVQTPNKCRGNVCGVLNQQRNCQSYRDRRHCSVSFEYFEYLKKYVLYLYVYQARGNPAHTP